jgi:transposase
MSYRELTMIDVKEVLRRWQAAQSERQIARETGIDRKTVGRYIATAEQLDLPRDRALDDSDVHAVAQRQQLRPSPDPSAEWKEIARHRARIEGWLGGAKPLRLQKVHLLLQREGLAASYATLRRYAIEELGWHKKEATVLLDDAPPGQEAQVDFGKMGLLFDAETERRRVLWVLIITLSFSRYMFVWPTFVQTTAAVCEGLDRAFRFFGAMPRTLIPDNMKAIVAEPDALSPRLTEAFTDYVQARGIFVDPARVRSPKDKPRVENQVPYVRENWFDGETFTDLEDARRSAEHWSGAIAGARVHGTTRWVPREQFEQSEKATMLAPPSAPFDVPLWTTAKVHADHHIEVARALYSVPTRYLHQRVRVRADRSVVRIYVGTELIKMHPRQPPGGRSTDTSDYPIGKAAYALRSVDALLDKARDKGAHVGTFAERLLAGPLPWARMRQGYALLRLCDKYGEGRVEAVCQSALSFDVIDVTRITKMLKRAATPTRTVSEDRKVVQLPLPRFARAREHFETRGDTTSNGGAS